ncbi:probable E3 ubiquitin-protein ligase RHB1A [Rutidosis leptorrhynchoides]|uniref:probable E3 ubiquitin-protein ligase RHB1A n=1 Tax=Rutidosis leptorrhynchoides TaxID=125765 RepID=UPI003A998B4C
MGGCCSSSRKYQLHGTPVYYYCPSASEEHESMTPRDSSYSTRLLVDVNLDTSLPDTYRSPPMPIPFDVVLGIPQTTNTARNGHAFGDLAYEKPTPTLSSVKKFDQEAVDDSAKMVDVGFQTSKSLDCSTMEEDDVCPTCFEEYDADNPKIVTKCNHQFHLSCILEWMERSDTCPICGQEMDFEAL